MLWFFSQEKIYFSNPTVTRHVFLPFICQVYACDKTCILTVYMPGICLWQDMYSYRLYARYMLVTRHVFLPFICQVYACDKTCILTVYMPGICLWLGPVIRSPIIIYIYMEKSVVSVHVCVYVVGGNRPDYTYTYIRFHLLALQVLNIPPVYMFNDITNNHTMLLN